MTPRLSALSIGEFVLTPSFNPETFEYYADDIFDAGSAKITAIPVAGATVVLELDPQYTINAFIDDNNVLHWDKGDDSVGVIITVLAGSKSQQYRFVFDVRPS